MTNIRDIACISGYSVSTVSRVFNQKNYVALETQLVHGIIHAAVQENYHVILLPPMYDAKLERCYLEKL